MEGDGAVIWLVLCAAALGLGCWAPNHLTLLAICAISAFAAWAWIVGAGKEIEGLLMIIPAFLWFVGLSASALVVNWHRIWTVIGPYIVQ